MRHRARAVLMTIPLAFGSVAAGSDDPTLPDQAAIVAAIRATEQATASVETTVEMRLFAGLGLDATVAEVRDGEPLRHWRFEIVVHDGAYRVDTTPLVGAAPARAAGDRESSIHLDGVWHSHRSGIVRESLTVPPVPDTFRLWFFTPLAAAAAGRPSFADQMAASTLTSVRLDDDGRIEAVFDRDFESTRIRFGPAPDLDVIEIHRTMYEWLAEADGGAFVRGEPTLVMHVVHEAWVAFGGVRLPARTVMDTAVHRRSGRDLVLIAREIDVFERTALAAPDPDVAAFRLRPVFGAAEDAK